MKKIIAILLSAMMLLTSCTQNDVNLQPKETSSISVESSELTSQSEEISMEDYLKDNAVSATEENISDMFKLIDNDRYDIFLNGEGHGTQNSYKFQFELIKYLNKNANVRYILMEAGFTAIEYLNIYFNTGDEEILNNYMSDIYGTFSYNNQYAEFCKQIYEYNKNLPKNEKLQFIGIDVDHVFSTAIRYLQDFLPSKTPPKEIENAIQNIKSYDILSATDRYDLMNDVRANIIQNFAQNKDIYKKYLNDKFDKYAFMMINLNTTYDYYHSEIYNNANYIREEQIYKNFKSCHPYLNRGKIFGQFGSKHINQINIPNVYNSFIAMLIENKELEKDKVCSIGNFYNNDCISSKSGTQSYICYSTYFSNFVNSKILSVIDYDYGLVKLTGKNSPFKYDKNILQYNFDGFATDLFQYVYVLKNSPACTKYTPIKK